MDYETGWTERETITVAQLRWALANLRFWLVPEEEPGTAYRGMILHPEDASADILIGVSRREEEDAGRAAT